MNSLTVVIAMKNEGHNLKWTLASIRRTQDIDVDILVIDDASTDKVDYPSMCTKYDARYIKNQTNRGVGASRHRAMAYVRTPNILIIDGHMRFRRDGWASKISNSLMQYPRSVHCTSCGYLDYKRLDVLNNQAKIDAELHTHGYQACSFKLDPLVSIKWLKGSDITGTVGTQVVPAIMGAGYAMTLNWYNHIGGLEYLEAWGQDEEYLSLKSWRFGGDCRLLLDVWVGHIWNTRGKGVSFKDNIMLSNKYVTTHMLPEPYKSKALEALKQEDKKSEGLRYFNTFSHKLAPLVAAINKADPDSSHLEALLELSKY